MSLSIVKTLNTPAPIGTYSQAVSCGNMLFVSEQIQLDPENGELVINSFAEQCHRVLLNLQLILQTGSFRVGQSIESNNLHEKPSSIWRLKRDICRLL